MSSRNRTLSQGLGATYVDLTKTSDRIVTWKKLVVVWGRDFAPLRLRDDITPFKPDTIFFWIRDFKYIQSHKNHLATAPSIRDHRQVQRFTN